MSRWLHMFISCSSLGSASFPSIFCLPSSLV
uniref:Uncharacterized protein n=1 Tax=Anguilla anguilla TaxID=7936 RepID=A0A0E9QDR1_ANGAN